jgi:hypothetical protein
MSIYFDAQVDGKTNHVSLTLKESHKLAFTLESPAWQELKEILLKLGEGYSATLNYGQDNCDFDAFDTFIEYLCDKKLVCHVSVHGGTVADGARNKILDNFYRYARRKTELNPETMKSIRELFQAPPKPLGKVRRAKQLLNRGIRLHTQTQYQHHHHKEHGVQREKQKQQQAEKQQAQNRQNQVQQQQQRMQATQRQLEDVNVGALGKLIHAGNLHELVDETLSLDAINAIWTNLVGEHAARVENPENRITHVPESTLRLIIKHMEQFSYGVTLDDLPHGFGFTVHKNEKNEPLSILYFDKQLLKRKRVDSLLAARLDDEKPVYDDFGDVGQFYPFFDEKSAKNKDEYACFVKQHELAFKHVFHPEKSTKTKKRLAAFIQLLILDNPELTAEALQAHFQGFSDTNLEGLRCILLEQGSHGVLLLFSKLRQLKQANQYESFKKYFMDSSTDWRTLLETTSTREGELNALDAIDYLCTMPAEEHLWWQAMMEQHVKANAKTNVIDLVNAHRYFFTQLKAMEPPVILPSECPITNISNMKTAYSRVLFLLNKAIDPQEQANYLSKLDFGMQGFICGVRKEPYVLITQGMDITPESNHLFHWNKYRKHAPTVPKGATRMCDTNPQYYMKKWFVPCALFKTSLDPMQCKARQFVDSNNPGDALILFGGELFYVERLKMCIKKIEITDSNRVNYEQLKECFTDSDKLADEKAHLLLISLVGQRAANGGSSFWSTWGILPNFNPGYDKNRDYTIPDEQGFAAPPYYYKGGFFSDLADALANKDHESPAYDHYEFLTRNEQGYLVNEVQLIYNQKRAPIQQRGMPRIYRTLIDDPQAQDEAILTHVRTLGYVPPAGGLLYLIELSQKLHYFGSLIKYFYRVIGTEPFAHPFATYQALIAQLDAAVLSKDETEQLALQKELLPLLVILSTGSRALKEERDILSDWNHLLMHIPLPPKMGGKKYPDFKSIINKEYLQRIVSRLLTTEPKPTLFEFTSLLRLTHDNGIIHKILGDDVGKYGELVYQLIKNVTQFNEQPDTTELELLLAFMRQCSDNERQTASLLGSITRKEDWPLLSGLEAAVSSIKNTEVKTHLHTLIGKINFNDSRPATIVEISELIKQLAKILEDDKEAYMSTLGQMKKYLPGIKFQDVDLSTTFALFIRQLAPFVSTLKDLATSLKENINKLDGMLEQGFISLDLSDFPLLSPETIKSYMGKTNEFAKGFLKDLTSQVDALCDVLNEIKAEDDGGTEKIKDVLKKIQGLLSLLDNPLKGFFLGAGLVDIAATIALRTMLNTQVIEPAKKQVLHLISENLLGMLRLQLSDSVIKLKINDAVLDKAGEDKTSLSNVLNDFLLAHMPEISGKDIAGEINQALTAHEDASGFVKSLHRLPKGAARDELLALLYRQGYFAKAKAEPPLSDLTELLKAFQRCQGINLATSFEAILAAHKDKVSLDSIKGLTQQLTNHTDVLTNGQFQALLHLGLTAPTRLSLVSQLVGLQKTLHQKNSTTTQQAFSSLLRVVSNGTIKKTKEALTACKELLQDNDIEAISRYVVRVLSADQEDELLQLAKMLKSPALNDETRAYAVSILQASCWESAEEDKTGVARQGQLISNLQKYPDGLKKLAEFYKTRPVPAFSVLETALAQERFTLDQWLHDYELDPFGKRAHIAGQFELRGFEHFVAEIKDLRSGKAIKGEVQEKLLDAVSYLLAVADQYGLPIGQQIKPIREFSRAEISQYYQASIQCVKKNPNDLKAKIEGLALLCESFFRTTGKYPYQSQIASVLSTLTSTDSLLLQIQTGQGKSTTLALMAAMNHSFGDEGVHTSVFSRNRLLTQRDFEENRDFFAYLNIPVAFVTSESEENHYAKPTIIYTTTSDKSLYDSRLKLVNNIDFPGHQVAICDEVDAEFFDNKNAFNFSESNEDPYLNPLEWIYPLANAFIERQEFINEGVFEEEDIRLFRNYIKAKDEQKYQQCSAKLNDAKLNQMLDGACAAKQLAENTDFIIRQKTREVHGVTQTISEAHLLVNHIEDKEATLSHGIQQALHARLYKEHLEEVARYKNTKGKEGLPPFSCDNVIDCVDSQNSHSVLKGFTRIIGATGTAGTKAELDEVAKTLNITIMLDIPPRCKSLLSYLPTVFADKETSFFFGQRTQQEGIKRALKQAKNQPVMICCASIDKANEFFSALEKDFPGKVQMIHAMNADDPEVFEALVSKASQPGQITIVTPLAGRGVDIKTKKARAGQVSKLEILAEKLLVIETNLERYRNRKQLQGRSARDGKAGQTVGIFDLDLISQQHGCDLKPLSQEGKLKALQSLMDKMDNEASLERQISSKVGSLINGYEVVFDGWIKTHHSDTAFRDQLLAAKSAFIERAEYAWNDCLADSDPLGRYENPYVRYNEDGELERQALDTLVNGFADMLKNVLFPECKQLIPLELDVPDEIFAAYDYTPNIEDDKDSDDILEEPPKLPTPSHTDAYFKFNKKAPETDDSNYQQYLRALALKTQFDRRVKYWIVDNPKVTSSVKEVAKQQQISILNHLHSQHRCEIRSFPAAVLHAMTQGMEKSKKLPPAYASQLLAFYSLAFYDLDVKVQDATPLCEAMVAFLGKALTLDVKNPHDQARLTSLSEDIKVFHQQGSIVRLLDLHHVVSKLLSVAEHDMKSTTTKDYLSQIKQVVNALVFTTSSPQVTQDTASRPQDDFKIMALGVKRLLQRTLVRMSSTYYQRLHVFSEAKINKVQEFLANHCSDKALKKFIAEHPSQSASELFQGFVNGLEKTLLATTTTWGKAGKTTSYDEFKRLIKRFDNEFSLNSLQSIATQYLVRLETIARNLEQRKNKAGLLKNVTLYDKKIEKLNLYIEKVKDLINKKNSMNITDVESEIRLIQHYIENDSDIYRSTARFFGLERNVTIVREVKEVANELLKKP